MNERIREITISESNKRLLKLLKKASGRVNKNDNFRMYLVPCSCGRSFAVSEDYDRKGTNWKRYLICPNCGKRHDPKNRLLELGYQDGFWKVDKS